LQSCRLTTSGPVLAYIVTIVPCKSAVSEISVGVSDQLVLLSTSIHS